MVNFDLVINEQEEVVNLVVISGERDGEDDVLVVIV